MFRFVRFVELLAFIRTVLDERRTLSRRQRILVSSLSSLEGRACRLESERSFKRKVLVCNWSVSGSQNVVGFADAGVSCDKMRWKLGEVQIDRAVAKLSANYLSKHEHERPQMLIRVTAGRNYACSCLCATQGISRSLISKGDFSIQTII